MRKKFIPLPPVEELWEHFEYAPLTGKLYWKERPAGNVKVGDEAGGLCKGYKSVSYKNQHYQAHRLIWKWMTCNDPKELFVDHRFDYVDGVYKSNYWFNLRIGTKSQNNANRIINSNNTSGRKGVYFDKTLKKWRARIRYHNKRIHLGYFDTPEEAHEAYKAKAIELHGEFARFE